MSDDEKNASKTSRRRVAGAHPDVFVAYTAIYSCVGQHDMMLAAQAGCTTEAADLTTQNSTLIMGRMR